MGHVDNPDVQVLVASMGPKIAYLVSATGVSAQVLLAGTAGCPMTWPVLCPTRKEGLSFPTGTEHRTIDN